MTPVCRPAPDGSRLFYTRASGSIRFQRESLEEEKQGRNLVNQTVWAHLDTSGCNFLKVTFWVEKLKSDRTSLVLRGEIVRVQSIQSMYTPIPFFKIFYRLNTMEIELFFPHNLTHKTPVLTTRKKISKQSQ